MSVNTADACKPGSRSSANIEAPSGDGKPMAETQRHAAAMFRAWHALGRQFADREDVYVGVNMLLYHVEGNPRRSVASDVFVVFGAPKLPPPARPAGRPLRKEELW